MNADSIPLVIAVVVAVGCLISALYALWRLFSRRQDRKSRTEDASPYYAAGGYYGGEHGHDGDAGGPSDAGGDGGDGGGD